MAHPCFNCGSECYCNGSIDDAVVDLTPKNCEGCDSCQERIEDRDGLYDDNHDDSYSGECPHCGRYYDNADYNFQKCSYCGREAEEEE